jgi:hypothetical protein
MEANAIEPNSYAWSAPYDGFWVEHFYAKHFKNLYGRKIVRERDMRKNLSDCRLRPEIMLMGNFVRDRVGIASLCRDAEIETIHGEDGFFPHYSTMHVDPMGFCWESSLPRLIFRKLKDKQRARSRKVREGWLQFGAQEIDQRIKAPFILWPLQLIGDRVNRCDLNLERWDELIEHFRNCMPAETQLVLKMHPRANTDDMEGISLLAERLPKTILLNKRQPLKPLLQACSGVAGVNSTVLYEARLMFSKPTYVYGRGWFTNHGELFLPVFRGEVRELNRADWILDNNLMRTEYRDEYTDWFLNQLLTRQIDRKFADKFPVLYKQRIFRLSHNSYREHGEEIFD